MQHTVDQSPRKDLVIKAQRIHSKGFYQWSEEHTTPCPVEPWKQGELPGQFAATFCLPGLVRYGQ